MSENNLTFEEAYTALEKIAEKLGSENLPLEESIKLYEQGIILSKYCTDLLNAAKQKVETLQSEAEK